MASRPQPGAGDRESVAWAGMSTVMDVLHVVTAVFIIGPMAILPMTGMRALRAGDAGQVATLARSTFVLSLVSIIVVVFGFGALGMSDPKYNLSMGTPWILISLIAYVIALALSLLVVVPALRAAGHQLTAAGSAGSVDAGQAAGSAGSIQARYLRVSASSGLVALLLLLAVVLMVWKP